MGMKTAKQISQKIVGVHLVGEVEEEGVVSAIVEVVGEDLGIDVVGVVEEDLEIAEEVEVDSEAEEEVSAIGENHLVMITEMVVLEAEGEVVDSGEVGVEIERVLAIGETEEAGAVLIEEEEEDLIRASKMRLHKIKRLHLTIRLYYNYYLFI